MASREKTGFFLNDEKGGEAFLQACEAARWHSIVRWHIRCGFFVLKVKNAEAPRGASVRRQGRHGVGLSLEFGADGARRIETYFNSKLGAVLARAIAQLVLFGRYFSGILNDAEKYQFASHDLG